MAGQLVLRGGWLATTLCELRGPVVFLLRVLSSALSRETHSSRVSHIAATRTGPPHARGNRAGTRFWDACSWRRGRRRRWWRRAPRRQRRRRAREAALLYVAPNLSRGNYCARNCRSERTTPAPLDIHATGIGL